MGTFNLVINGEPVADPLIRLAAFPTFLFTLFFTAILIFVAFLGIGLFTFFLVLVLLMLGVVLVAPYFWPVLAMIFVLIILIRNIGGQATFISIMNSRGWFKEVQGGQSC